MMRVCFCVSAFLTAHREDIVVEASEDERQDQVRE